MAGRSGPYSNEGSKAQVFGSKDERDRWQIMQYGNIRNAFREPNEAPDGRPVLVYPDPFWSDYTEELNYEAVVEVNSKRDGEGLLTYLGRVLEAVGSKYSKAGLEMPRTPTRREREAQLAKLRAQARMPYRDDEEVIA